jgi:rhodanese-related sulfurtransferase
MASDGYQLLQIRQSIWRTRASLDLHDELSPAEVTQRAGLTVVDVRQPAERELGCLPGSRSEPLQRLRDDGPPRDLDFRSPILTVCLGGVRGCQAAELFWAWGYHHVFNLAGGMKAWSEAGMPLSRGDTTRPLAGELPRGSAADRD